MMKKICHLTSVHPAFDIRIFYKECKTLLQAGYEVVLIAPHEREEEVEGVRIQAFPKARNRFERMTQILWQIYKTAIKENADLYHFHDVELIPVGILLKLHNKKVIYDVHEDYSQALLSREWIFPWLRPQVTRMVKVAEWAGTKLFDGIVTATPQIANLFPPSKTITIQNFPIIDEFAEDTARPYQERLQVLIYLGAISVLRGVKEMVAAMSYLPKTSEAKLWLAGKFSPAELETEIGKQPGWDRVNFLGWQSHEEVLSVIGKARLGLLLLHPIPNHITSRPNKLFEYMAGGIPVIASNFPLWREIIEGAGCGVLVDPFDIKRVAESIKWLLEAPEEAEKMGKRGQEVAFEHYNWDIEGQKLLQFYDSILRFEK